MKKYYSMSVSENDADIYIYGDILEPTSREWWGVEADVSGYDLAKEVKDLQVSNINVHINSYGGHVSEGLAIYNILRQHPAHVRTYCDGFACSAASVVFMAGDERTMGTASLLMIHNAWNTVSGNADDLRKEADDLELISQTAANAYREAISISDAELEELLKNESWISPGQAIEWGFATAIASTEKTSKASQSAMPILMRRLTEQDAKADSAPLTIDDLRKALREELNVISPTTKEQDPKPAEKIPAFFNFKEDNHAES